MENNTLYVDPSYRAMEKADHVESVESDLVEYDIAGRTFNHKLNALRRQNHFVEISQFTNKAIACVLAPNVAVDINLPSGTKMVRFNSDGFFTVSRNGRAQLPPASLVTGDADSNIGSFCPNTNVWYYVEEIQQLSIVSDMQVRISIECVAQQ